MLLLNIHRKPYMRSQMHAIHTCNPDMALKGQGREEI